MAACPDLKLLVTSQAVLHVQGEQEYPVPPLVLPDLTRLPEPEVLVHYTAITLFLQRAQAVKPTFRMAADNAHPIAEIRVFYQDRFLCRAICPELSGQTISLKEIEKARAGRSKQVKAGLTERQAVVEQFIAVHQEVAPQVRE